MTSAAFTREMTGHHKGLEGVLVLEPGDPGLNARVFLDGHDFAIETEDGERHEWPRDDIAVTPFDTCTTELQLDGARLFFRAADPLEFSDRLSVYLAAPTKRKRPRADGAPKTEREPASVVEVDLRQAVGEAELEDPFALSAEPGRSSRWGRRRGHEHAWVSRPAGGGIVRRRCRECGVMSIDATTLHLEGDPAAIFSRRR